jgi:Integrase core domain
MRLFHRTLKRWLAQQPVAENLTELQHQLGRFRHLYNHHRPHRAAPPYPKLPPPGPGEPGHYRLRCDRLDTPRPR